MRDLQGIKLDSIKDSIIVGVDVAKKKHWARIVDPAGYDLTKPFSFQNTIDGFGRLVDRIHKALTGSDLQRVVVGMEATGHYGKPLTWFLLNEARHLDVAVVLVNPMHVKRQKELIDNSPTKNDRKDTAVNR